MGRKRIKIDYPEYALLAERQIKKKLPQWETFTGEDLIDFETAIVLQTAMKCYSQVPNNIKAKQTANMKIEYKDKTNPTSLIDNLIEKLNEILIMLTESDEDLFIGFVVT